MNLLLGGVPGRNVPHDTEIQRTFSSSNRELFERIRKIGIDSLGMQKSEALDFTRRAGVVIVHSRVRLGKRLENGLVERVVVTEGKVSTGN